MTTTVNVAAPGYEGKKVVIFTAPNTGAEWKKHSVLSAGQIATVVAHDSQIVCVKEYSDAEYAEAFPED